MNFRILFVVIAAMFLVVGANATIINTTVLLTTNYGGELQLGNAIDTSDTYTYSCPDDHMIVFSTIYPRTGGQTLAWTLDRGGGTQLSGTIALQSTSLVSGNVVSTIAGGTSSSIPYYLIFNPTMTIFFVKGDLYYYLVIADNSRFIYAVSGDIYHPVYAPFYIDTDTDSYLQLSENPTTYPVQTLSIYPSSGNYIVMPYYESVEDTKIAEIYTEDTQAGVTSGDILSFLQGLIKAVYRVIDAIALLNTTLGSFLNVFSIFVSFIFAVQIFIGLNVVYIAIAIILSIAESDDLFYSFGKFYKYIMKLFRFYMEIIRAIRSIIKWW